MRVAVSLWRNVHRVIASLLLATLFVPVMGYAAEWNIDRLMQSLAKVQSGRAAFTEKKYMSMLERPLESSGELLYKAPDRLEKRTFKPSAETMVVEGGTLIFQRGRQKHTVQLQEYPEIAGFIDSIRGTLAGDRKILERTFKLKLEGPSERWILSLVPADVELGKNIHLIRIAGNQDQVRSIEIIQADGDRSVMTIEPIKPE